MARCVEARLPQGARAPRARGQHQQRHHELRRRARGRATSSAPSSTRSASARAGWTARRSGARATWSPSGRAARGRAAVLLIGHLDTVFETDSPFQRFERLTGEPARGPGHHRHEGRRRRHAAGARARCATRASLDRMRITVVLTRRRGGLGRRRSSRRGPTLIAAAAGAGRRHRLRGRRRQVRERGRSRAAASSGWRLAVTGKPAHSSLDLPRGDRRTARSTSRRASSTPSAASCAERGVPDLQPRRRSWAARRRARPEQRAARRSGRPTSSRQGGGGGRPAHALARAARAHARAHAGDRRADTCRTRPPRSPSSPAIRRWRRPRATGACSRSSTRPAATSGWARSGAVDPRGRRRGHLVRGRPA